MKQIGQRHRFPDRPLQRHQVGADGLGQAHLPQQQAMERVGRQPHLNGRLQISRSVEQLHRRLAGVDGDGRRGGGADEGDRQRCLQQRVGRLRIMPLDDAE